MKHISKNRALYNIIVGIIVLILFLDSSYFYIINLSENISRLNSANNKYLILLLIGITIILLFKTTKMYFFKKIFWWKYTIWLLSVQVFLSIYSMYMYNQSIFDVFTSSHHLLLVIMVIPLLYTFIKNDDIEEIMNIVNCMAIIMCIILIAQSIIYNKTGIIFLDGISVDFIQVRRGNIRLAVSSIVNLTIIYNATNIFCNNNITRKKRQTYGVFLIIELYTLLSVQMSRIALIVAIGTILVIILSNKGIKFKKYIVIIIAFIILITFVDIGDFINSFSIDSGTGMELSTSTRIEAVEYYSDIFFRNPIFGNGFIRDSREDLRTIVHGIGGVYYYADVGILGLAAEQGLLGISVYMYVIIFMINTLYKMKKNRYRINKVDYGFVVGIIVYWIFSSFTLIITDAVRSIMIPLTIAIFEFYRIKYKLNNKESI